MPTVQKYGYSNEAKEKAKKDNLISKDLYLINNLYVSWYLVMILSLMLHLLKKRKESADVDARDLYCLYS